MWCSGRPRYRVALGVDRPNSVRGPRSMVCGYGLGAIRVDCLRVDSRSVVLDGRTVPGELVLPRVASVEDVISVLWPPQGPGVTRPRLSLASYRQFFCCCGGSWLVG